MIDSRDPAYAAPADPRGALAMEAASLSEGQRHDRIRNLQDLDEDYEPQDVTVAQKMLSAVTGSIFTSLLGSCHCKSCLTIVTPLDVVRVRLQSQAISPQPEAAKDFRVSAASSVRSFQNLPQNLGVTACCREVFWVTNNTPYCVAGDAAVAGLGNSGNTSTTECVIEEAQLKKYNSTLDGLRKIARNEGVGSLWRGLSPTLVMAVPGNVIYFAGYDWLRTSNHSPIKSRISETYSPLFAGSFARVLAAFVVGPIELFRTRMQAGHATSAASNFYQTLRGVREMVQSEGPRSLWRGLSLTLWRDVPFSALYWWGYEAVRNTITDARDRRLGREVDPLASPTRSRSNSRRRQDHTTTMVDSFVAGAASGAVASLVTTPFDVGKTRQQVYRHSPGTVAGADRVLLPEERSMPRFLAHIVKTEGFSGLFRGWAPRMLKVAPACAIMISSYEIGKKMAQHRQEHK